MDRLEHKVGIFGGSFDPPHIAHLRVAEEVREALELDEIWFIPAGNPPHKKKTSFPFEDRFTMLKLSTKTNPYFKVLDIERDLKPSYTLSTLKILKEKYPQIQFYLLLGWDAFLEIDTWYHYQEIPSYTEIVVLSRGKDSWQGLFLEAKERVYTIWGEEVLKRVHFLEVSPFEISSTQIRALLREGKTIRYLVPEEVYFYIQENYIQGKNIHSTNV